MQNLIQLVAGFIAVVIMLLIGSTILGSISIECGNLSKNANANWSATCENVSVQAISGFGLIVVGLIVLGAVIIMSIVRLLG